MISNEMVVWNSVMLIVCNSIMLTSLQKLPCSNFFYFACPCSVMFSI
uniref:Uncharacterized protein n=1 Tax=Arundo donax TaxID=35708 RepID=A0A0A9HPJ5_ARUDO